MNIWPWSTIRRLEMKLKQEQHAHDELLAAHAQLFEKHEVLQSAHNELIASVSKKAAERPPRRARTFTEWNAAAENGAVPQGMTRRP